MFRLYYSHHLVNSFLISVEKTEINAPRGCAVILIGICQLRWPKITHQVSRTFDLNTGNTEVTLTNREFEILYLLASSPGRVFSKEQIYDLVWEEPYFGDYNIVMSHIRNIREKIGDNPSKPIYIQTVWGVGYRFNKNISSGLWVDYRSLLIFHF